MSTSQSHDPSLLDRTNLRELVHVSSPAPYPHDAAVSGISEAFDSCDDLRGACPQDPFAYYKAFLNANVSTAIGTNDDGASHPMHSMHPVYPVSLEARTTHDLADQQQIRARPAPYNAAVRYSNRLNGLPLSTIVEQGSYSTLNSNGSPSSVGRYPSIRVINEISPNTYTYRASQSLDETPLRRIEEVVAQGQHTRKGIPAHPGLEDDRIVFDPQPITSTPIKSSPPGHQASDIYQTPSTDDDLEGRGLKGFLRGVLHNVRGSSRHDRPQSSSVTTTPAFRQGGLATNRSSSGVQYEENDSASANLKKNRIGVSASLPHDRPESEARTRISLGIDRERSSRSYPPILHLPPASSDINAELASPHFLPPPHSSPSPERAPSTTPRDTARERSLSDTHTPSLCSRENLSTRYTFDGVPLHRINTPSLREYDRAREASICSTASTTYSGTVLGIDLDLKQEHASVARPSPTPVWSGPRQPIGPSARRQKPAATTPRTPHSITSSALPVLLPLAAASGIVRQNHATAQTSFFSPSGNLIQAENSSSPAVSPSLNGQTRPMTNCHNILSINPMGESPIRPAPVPLTTPPPTTRAPLPAYLRHHHNYQHPAHSHIVPQQPRMGIDMILTPSPNVKGCGGVVRRRSLQPRSGVPQSQPQPRQQGSIQDYRRSNRFTFCSSLVQLRDLSLDNLTSCMRGPSTQVGNGIVVGRVRGVEGGARASKPHHTLTGKLGPLAGHALRVCFCQPWDGDEDTDGVRARHAGACKGSADAGLRSPC
ncbi:hypothetical protein K504DRAFT_504188 [Pleomassaria siparia CBS 279.74]|uniref:Uncharacterized protein n=1 Tax=Pleomassaria siparia CBS 279.74 TaxID=1314801 RepID=A0A6G1K293_9PLEO|nr:hypothetical protein K504DRAFT_504188 [Pleomassaria siparia CBS 279.74]